MSSFSRTIAILALMGATMLASPLTAMAADSSTSASPQPAHPCNTVLRRPQPHAPPYAGLDRGQIKRAAQGGFQPGACPYNAVAFSMTASCLRTSAIPCAASMSYLSGGITSKMAFVAADASFKNELCLVLR